MAISDKVPFYPPVNIFLGTMPMSILHIYTVRPYKKGDRFQDNYNYYHSPQCITVECAAFGMPVQKLSILQWELQTPFGLANI